MHSSILLLIGGIFYLLLISVLYFGKKRIKLLENKIYEVIIILGIFGSVVDIAGIYAHLMLPETSILRWLIVKLYLLYLFAFVLLMTMYILFSVIKNNKKGIKMVFVICTTLFIIGTIMNFILPFEYYNNGNTVYIFGLNAIFLYGISGITMIGWLVFILLNIKKLDKIKYIPMLAFVLIGFPIAYLQMVRPELLLVTSLITFIIVLMYHTIENPDLKMMEELYKNKTLVEKTYEDKSNFLFEMTQEVREPLFKINNLCKEIDEEKDTEVIKEGAKLINTSVKQLDFIVNDVLDVTSLDVQKVRTINTNYNINNLYEDIVTRTNSIVPKNIEFKHSIISTNKYLYGDNIKLKQIIMSILMNSIKKTKEGYIEFSIDTIERYDVVRLVVKIIDSGSGMSIDKINDILEATGELSSTDIENMEKMELNLQLCQKIIKLLGGNLMIKSGDEKGTEVILTIDQKVKQIEDASVLNKYEGYINKEESILIVSQNKKLVNDIEEKLKDKDINITTSLFGAYAIDKIKSGKKYKLILMDDEMKDMNGYTTFKELESIKGFKIPVVIMLDKLKDKIKDQYISDGFDSYLLIENFNEEIDKIIDKYMI